MARDAQEIVSEFSLVRKICSLLKLGDIGKLESFFNRVIKSLNKEIAANVKNIEVLKFNHTQALEELDDEIEDAQQSYEDSYLKVDVSKLNTNESQKEFQEVYLLEIANKAKIVEDLKKKKETLVRDHEAEIKEIEDTIALLKERVSKISESK